MAGPVSSTSEPRTLLSHPELASQHSFPTFRTIGEAPKGPLERVLSIFADVRAGEGLGVLLLATNIFVILACYYLLRSARQGLILTEGAPFGWKLPEFLLVLPCLFDAFPAARAVLLVRHPVAAALRRPHVTTMPDHHLGRVVLPAAYRAAGRDPADVATDPPHLRQALAWRHQVGRAARFLDTRVAPAHRLVVRLEDFALSPEATVARLAAFVGAPVAPAGALAPFDAARAAPPRDPAAAARVRDLCADVAATVGYGPGWLDAPVERPERRAWFTGLA